MHQVTCVQLHQWISEERDFLLIDVREEWEHEAYNIGGILISSGTLITRKNELPIDKDIVIYCEKGIRSAIAIQRLEALGFEKLHNLTGGMKAWKEFQKIFN